MRNFIEKQTEKSEEAFKAVNAQSRNIINQAVSFIDNLIQDSTTDDVDQRVHFTKGLFSLRIFLNQYLKQQDAAIVRLDAIGSLIEKFEKEGEIKEKLANGEDPQKRAIGEKPITLKDIRNIKSDADASQELHGQKEVPPTVVVEVEDV